MKIRLHQNLEYFEESGTGELSLRAWIFKGDVANIGTVRFRVVNRMTIAAVVPFRHAHKRREYFLRVNDFPEETQKELRWQLRLRLAVFNPNPRRAKEGATSPNISLAWVNPTAPKPSKAKVV